MAGHTNLCLAAKLLSRFAYIAVTLPQVHTVGTQPLGERYRIVNNESHLMRSANRLQWLGQGCGFVLVKALYPELEGGHHTLARFDRTFEPLREVSPNVER